MKRHTVYIDPPLKGEILQGEILSPSDIQPPPDEFVLTIGEIVKLCLGIGIVFGLVGLSISMASGAAVRRAAEIFLRSFAYSAGIGAVIIFVVVVLRYVAGIERLIWTVGLLKLAEKKIEANTQVEMARVETERVRIQAQWTAQATVQSARAYLNAAALQTAGELIDGRYAESDIFRDKVDVRLWRALQRAYEIMDPQTGCIPNNLPGGVPFSKNNMSPYYEEARQRLLDPGSRWGRPGAWPWIAQPIHGGHTWQINVRDYPELEDVVPVLFGVSLEEMNRLVGRMRPPKFEGGNGQSTTLPYRSGTATAG